MGRGLKVLKVVGGLKVQQSKPTVEKYLEPTNSDKTKLKISSINMTKA